MEIAGIILGLLGVAGTIYFGLRSKKVADAFGKYVELEEAIQRLDRSAKDYKSRVAELESAKSDIYRHQYSPKSKAFVPGDRVKLIRPLKDRSWISDHAKIGMTGIVVDFGPGTYEFLVYWSGADYEGQPIDDHDNRWQPFLVNKDDIERIA